MASFAQILDGKKVSEEILNQIACQILEIKNSQPPKLAAVLVGDNPASEIYVSRKIKTAARIGIQTELYRYPSTLDEQTLKKTLQSLNKDSSVNAILVQLPLPSHIKTDVVLQTVSPIKDVDGFHPENLGKLLLGMEHAASPCTPSGIIKLIKAYNISIDGLRAAIIGRSNIVGKPLALLLTNHNATVTLCHSKTRQLDDILMDSDLIVSAMGKACFIGEEVIKQGAVVIDVGINRLASGTIVGDVDFERVKEKASFITPVPGGVGPMTIAMLMYNTLRLYQLQNNFSLKMA